MSIYITGDTHGDPRLFLDDSFSALRRGDTLLIAGDFGYLFSDNVFEDACLDLMEGQPYRICFVDGNHENFPAIARHPVERWHGGLVHKIRRNVFHLMRGQVFTIEGKTFFTFGGGYSRDRLYRTPGVSWWPEELPSQSQCAEALHNLDARGRRVDYILTHTIPLSVILQMQQHPDGHEAALNQFLELVLQTVQFRHWYAGHWHLDQDFRVKADPAQEPDFTILFKQLRKLP